MDVTVTDLRANLTDWLRHVRNGEEVVVMERGAPVARIVRITASALLDELEAEGIIARPRASSRPWASGRARVRARQSVSDQVRPNS